MKLSDAAVRNAKGNGKVQKLSDGGGLYLHVTATGSKLWRLAYRFEGKKSFTPIQATVNYCSPAPARSPLPSAMPRL